MLTLEPVIGQGVIRIHWVGGIVCSVTGTGDIEFHAITRYHPTYQHRIEIIMITENFTSCTSDLLLV